MLTSTHAVGDGVPINTDPETGNTMSPLTPTEQAEALRQERALDDVRAAITAAARDLAASNQTRDTAVAHCRKIANRAYELGMPEKHIAIAMNVNRRTIRRWLGKPE